MSASASAGADRDRLEDLGEVRADEQMDWPKVEALLRAEVPDLPPAPMQVRQFRGGSANLTYLLLFGERQMVLRRPPLGPVGKGAHDMKREHRVLSRLHRALATAPRAFLFCDDPAVIGADFFVMERRTGVVVRDAFPPEMTGFADLERRISLAVVRAMADLHLVDPDAVDLGSLGRPEGFMERQLSGWKMRWEDAKDADIPLFYDLHDRLAAEIPALQRVSLVHNDLKIDNCQFQADDPDTVTSIFDWDMTTRGDPLADLGTLLGYWNEPGDPAQRMVMPPPVGGSYPSRQEIAAEYADRMGGFDLSRLHWYEAFAMWKTATVVQQIYIRYARGQTKDERFRDMNGRIPPLLQMAEQTLDAVRYG
ncbi:phosphotransferase family protein [Marinibaculum pumilum]|uniref:Phosphotransferase family protein n=1 Tax=Marinibaculum pumilum TaxID=1766165 RepID=A0ABV7L968_9PROT